MRLTFSSLFLYTQARKMFEAALERDADLMDAVLALADLNIAEEQFDAAIALCVAARWRGPTRLPSPLPCTVSSHGCRLRQHLHGRDPAATHTKLASVLCLAGDTQSAVAHYKLALDVSPGYKVCAL